LRIALFVTCLGDTLAPEVGIATVSVLERLGHEVVFPAGQTCCGQLHANSGYRREALSLARRFVEVFGSFDVVVSPSSSCVGMVREIYPVLAREAGDDTLERQVAALASNVFELSELLADHLGLEDVGASFPHKVTYHSTCHSLRVTRVGDAPIRLLSAVQGLELLELPGARECCGFGGTFAVTFPNISSAMGDLKLEHIRAVRPDVLVSGDMSCLMHLGGLAEKEGSPIKILHFAQVLRDALRQGGLI